MYNVIIAIPNSVSMGEGAAGVIALVAVPFVNSALRKLEFRWVAVTSGATIEGVPNFDSGLHREMVRQLRGGARRERQNEVKDEK